jgi:hypothetical protein
MSINSMVDLGVSNHLASQVAPNHNASVPVNVASLTAALADNVPAAAAIKQASQAAQQDAWSRITTFIPTEIIAAYVAVLGVIVGVGADDWKMRFFYIFLGLCPLAVITGYAGKIRTTTGKFPPLRSYPLFAVVAAPLAFAVWGIGLPNSIVAAQLGLASWAGAVLIILSALILGQLSTIFA